jgi:hypothetical protein
MSCHLHEVILFALCFARMRLTRATVTWQSTTPVAAQTTLVLRRRPARSRTVCEKATTPSSQGGHVSAMTMPGASWPISGCQRKWAIANAY